MRIPADRSLAIRRLPPGLAWVAALFLTTLVSAQQDDEPYPIKGQITIDPEFMQLEIPDGKIRLPGAVDRVVTADRDGRRVVGKVHAMVDNNFVILLPDGQLVGRKREDVEATEREFVPATHEEIAEAIMDEHGLDGFQVEKTKHFVLIYNTSPEFAKVTTKVMETMLQGVIKYTRDQGLDTFEPKIPLPIVAFHRTAQFQEYKPMPPAIAAYYEINSNRVILKEESMLAAAGREDLARKELLSTIAHEGCHQILHNIGVQQRLSRWPMWLGEGIAEYMAPTEPGNRFAWKGAGKINDLRMHELEIFLQKQFVKGFDGDTVDQTVRAGRLDSTGYSAAWTLTHYLAKQRKPDFDRYMRYLSRMAPLHGMMPEDLQDPKATVEQNMVHFKAFFGDDLVELENDLVKFMRLDSRRTYDPPLADYPHVVGLALVPGIEGDKRFSCFFPAEHHLQEWVGELQKTLNDYEKEHAEIYTSGFPNRGLANKAVTDFMKGRKTPGRRNGRR